MMVCAREQHDTLAMRHDNVLSSVNNHFSQRSWWYKHAEKEEKKW